MSSFYLPEWRRYLPREKGKQALDITDRSMPAAISASRTTEQQCVLHFDVAGVFQRGSYEKYLSVVVRTADDVNTIATRPIVSEKPLFKNSLATHLTIWIGENLIAICCDNANVCKCWWFWGCICSSAEEVLGC
jgi:hypothetical protein